MAASNAIATKRLMNIQVGDRIRYTSGDLVDWNEKYGNQFIPLSGEVLETQELSENLIQLSTSSGLLRPYEKTVEFDLVTGDYEGVELQRQYDVLPPEMFKGVSIE